mgnify:CR=1 FL=1
MYSPMRKMTYEGWLTIGYSDWDEEEIPYNEANRWMIKSFFEYIKINRITNLSRKTINNQMLDNRC